MLSVSLSDWAKCVTFTVNILAALMCEKSQFLASGSLVYRSCLKVIEMRPFSIRPASRLLSWIVNLLSWMRETCGVCRVHALRFLMVFDCSVSVSRGDVQRCLCRVTSAKSVSAQPEMCIHAPLSVWCVRVLVNAFIIYVVRSVRTVCEALLFLYFVCS